MISIIDILLIIAGITTGIFVIKNKQREAIISFVITILILLIKAYKLF